METIDYIGDCVVHTLYLENEDYFGSDINEEILEKHFEEEKELNEKYSRFSPLACNNLDLLSTAA